MYLISLTRGFHKKVRPCSKNAVTLQVCWLVKKWTLYAVEHTAHTKLMPFTIDQWNASVCFGSLTMTSGLVCSSYGTWLILCLLLRMSVLFCNYYYLIYNLLHYNLYIYLVYCVAELQFISLKYIVFKRQRGVYFDL